MNEDILTTAQTAKLLGVSVRTAQLLIEGGALPTWKTPGGHRRVFRRDVEAIINDAPLTRQEGSAKALVVAQAKLRRKFQTLAPSLAEGALDYADDFNTALIAIGDHEPAVIIAEEAEEPLTASFISAVLGSTNIASDHIILVSPAGASSQTGPAGLTRVASAEAAVTAVRHLLQDPPSSRMDPKTLPYPVALNEQQRLVALERSGLMDSAPGEGFDRIAWLTAKALDAPVALVTLLTSTRQLFKARIGLDMTETPRSSAFCNHTIVQRGVFMVEDLSLDPLFATNPAVAGEPNFRFYAGAPILNDHGFALGSLCIMDFAPRRLDDGQTRMLAELARLASTEIGLREAKRKSKYAQRGSRSGARAKRPFPIST